MTVLDVSFYLPSRWAGMLLATMGADVISIEMPRSSSRTTSAAVTRDLEWLGLSTDEIDDLRVQHVID